MTGLTSAEVDLLNALQTVVHGKPIRDTITAAAILVAIAAFEYGLTREGLLEVVGAAFDEVDELLSSRKPKGNGAN